MIKKHFTLRRSLVSCFAFLSLLLLGISCATEDHVVPEEPQPQVAQITTLDISGNVQNGFSYSVQFSNLGNIPVTEYGIVTYAGEPGDVKNPTIEILDQLDDRKYAFTGAGYMPPNLAAKTLTKLYDGPTGTIEDQTVRLKYRAYAMLNNNTVIYGEIKFIDFELAPNNNTVKPVIKTLNAEKGEDSEFIVYNLQFESLGNVNVTDYGIVIYQGKQNEQQTPEVPTDSPFEKKYQHIGAADLNAKNIIQAYDGQTDDPIRLFYRAYAVLENGEVVYGEVKFLDFEILLIPKIETLVAIQNFSDVSKIEMTFRMKFTELGNKPVFQYGIVFAEGEVGESIIPDFPITSPEYWRSISGEFDGPSSVALDYNEKLINDSFTRSDTKVLRIFYRAYAKLSNGTFVYGDTQFFDIDPKP